MKQKIKIEECTNQDIILSLNDTQRKFPSHHLEIAVSTFDYTNPFFYCVDGETTNIQIPYKFLEWRMPTQYEYTQIAKLIYEKQETKKLERSIIKRLRNHFPLNIIEACYDNKDVSIFYLFVDRLLIETSWSQFKDVVEYSQDSDEHYNETVYTLLKTNIEYHINEQNEITRKEVEEYYEQERKR